MSWLKFIYWTSGLYALYYLANIAWDLLRQKSAPKEGTQELTFSDAQAPEKIEPPLKKNKEEPEKKTGGDPVISAMGGVGLKDLFNLAKAEVIAYNRAVTF